MYQKTGTKYILTHHLYQSTVSKTSKRRVGIMSKIGDWVAVNRVTGEEVEIDMLAVRDGGEFNKVFVGELAGMIGCTGTGGESVLAWILKTKNNKNEIHGTQREIGELLGVSKTTVSKVFKALESNDYLRIKRSGCYVINPSVIHYGGIGNKIAILKIWDSLT